MENFELKQLIKSTNIVRFTYYKDNNLWYRVFYKSSEVGKTGYFYTGFEFPVYVLGENITFHGTDNAIEFIKYIKKYLEETKMSN